MSGHPARPTAAPFCGLFQQGPDGPRSPHVAHTGGPGFPFVGNEAATATPQFPRDAGSRSALAGGGGGGGGGGGSAPGTWNSQHHAQSHFRPAGNSAVLPASSAAAAGGRMTTTTTMMMSLNSSSSGRSSRQQQNLPHFSREPISQGSKLQPTPPSHNGQQQQHQGPTWARSGQRQGMSEERASNILATFGLSSEDLGHLAAYPDEELTPHNLPRILQEIQSRKRDNGFATTTIANHNDERTRRIGEGRSGSLVPYRVDVPDGDGLGHVLYAGTSSFSCKELLEVYNPEEPTSDGYEDAREWALPGSCEFAPPSETDSVKSCGSGSGSATGSGSGCASRMGRSDAVRPPAGARGPAALGWERLGRTEPTAEEAEDFLGLPAAAFPRTCAVCGVRLLCDKGWRQHITGKKHKSKCRVFALRFPTWRPAADSLHRSPPQFGLPGNGPSPSVDGPSGASPAFGGFAALPSLPPGAPPTPAQQDGAGRPDSAGRVVHFHNLPPVAFTEADIIRLGLPFGKVTNYILMRSKNQAFLEMARPEAARALVRTYAAQPPLLQEQPVAVQMSSSYQRLVLKKPGRPVDEVLMEETGHSARARAGTAQSRVRSRSPLSRDRESPTANAVRSFSPVPWKRSRSPWRRESLSSSSPGPSTPSPRRQPQSPLENPSQGRTRPTSPREHEATMDDGETMMRESETTTTRENGARLSPAPNELEDLAQGAWRRDPTERRGDGAGETRGGASTGGGAGGGATEEPSRLHALRDRDEEQDFFLGDVGFVTVDEVGAEEEMGEEEKGSVHLVVGEGSGGGEEAAADEVAAAAATASVAARLVDERAPPGGGDRPSGDEVANLPDVAPHGGDAADTEETAPAPVPAANGDGRSEETADADAEAPALPREPRGTRDEPASFPRSRSSESDGDVRDAEGPRPRVMMEGDEGAGSGDDRRDGLPGVVKPAGQPLAPEILSDLKRCTESPACVSVSAAGEESLSPPIGVNFVVPRTGFYCLLCRLFYVCESSAREGHCRSPTHYRNVERYLIQRLRELGESGLGEAMGAECGEHVAEGHRTQL
ncbi:RNA-binding protein 20-like isoform X2 [Lethenteron reissneri]|nr:RNA-binding protein 20-like isoform X2 [Lethenteron reissneri]